MSLKRNLVLGFCTGYSFGKIESFVASVLGVSSSAQLCLYTSGLDERFYHVAARKGVRIEDASPYLKRGYHPQNSRYFAYRDFLRHAGAEYGSILLTDVRDVFFQSDPFAIRHPKPVCFALEDTKIMWEQINQGWLRDIYGDELLQTVWENHVACSGTTLGTANRISIYLDTLCAELEHRSFDRMQVYDQGIHNYIVWKLRPDWGWIDTVDAIVNTVGCTGPERITIVDDLVVIDGKVSPVVHQWDRHPHLRTHVETSQQFRIGTL